MEGLLFIASRLLKAVGILLAVAVVNFGLIRLAPGDPAAVMAGEAGASDEVVLAQLREEFGLDRPLPVQLGIYVRNLLSFDLGQSYRQKRAVAHIVGERMPATLILTSSAFLLSLALGMGLGIIAAARVGTWTDTVISAAALLVFATPIYCAGLLAVLLFSVQLGILPAFGMETLGAGYTGLQRVGDVLKHLLMPMITLALFYTAMYARLMRSSMLEVQFEEYIKTARAKGAGPRRIILHHALRNAVLPVITMAGIQAGHLMGGAILIETVFAWPGLGRLALEAVTQRDYNVLLGTFVVASAMGLFFNILTDIIYTIVDPRIGLASR